MTNGSGGLFGSEELEGYGKPEMERPYGLTAHLGSELDVRRIFRQVDYWTMSACVYDTYWKSASGLTVVRARLPSDVEDCVIVVGVDIA